MKDVFEEAVRLRKEGVPAALVTVVGTKGSTPRERGTKMVVTAKKDIMGTIGGATVEARIIEDALDVIRSGESRQVGYDLDDLEKASTGMVCGGKMEFFIEPLNPPPMLYIFGAGHVAYPLARMARMVGFNYTIIDDRAEWASPERFSDAQDILVGPFEEVVPNIDYRTGSFMVVITRCHETDGVVLENILEKNYRYLGMICSRRKKKEVFDQLKAKGKDPKMLAGVHAPIGLPIGGKSPEEIAVSILAEMIQVLHRC